MKTPIAIINETLNASEILKGMASCLEDEIEDSLILITDRDKLDKLWMQIVRVQNELETSAYKMQEENLNLQNA